MNISKKRLRNYNLNFTKYLGIIILFFISTIQLFSQEKLFLESYQMMKQIHYRSKTFLLKGLKRELQPTLTVIIRLLRQMLEIF